MLIFSEISVIALRARISQDLDIKMVHRGFWMQGIVADFQEVLLNNYVSFSRENSVFTLLKLEHT